MQSYSHFLWKSTIFHIYGYFWTYALYINSYTAILLINYSITLKVFKLFTKHIFDCYATILQVFTLPNIFIKQSKCLDLYVYTIPIQQSLHCLMQQSFSHLKTVAWVSHVGCCCDVFEWSLF